MTSYEHLNHLVGNPSFDADMKAVEAIVHVKNHPENTLARADLHAYYISRLLDYWIKVRAYVTPKFYPKRKFYRYKDAKKFKTEPIYTDEQIVEFYKYFSNQIIQAEQHFIATQQIDIIRIGNTFDYLANIFCFDADPTKNQYWTENPYIRLNGHYDMLYPLPNEVGLFGINTYMYAFFERVLLIGIPTKRTGYDKEKGCPHRFLDHDFDHSSRLMYLVNKEPAAFELDRNFYYTVLNQSDLTSDQKECHVLLLFLFIHEFPGVSLQQYNLQTNAKRVFSVVPEWIRRMLYYELESEFAAEFRKYSAFTYTIENVDSLLAAIRENINSFEEDFLLKVSADLIKLRENLTMDVPIHVFNEKEQERLDYFLGYWYHIQYINAYLAALN